MTQKKQKKFKSWSKRMSKQAYRYGKEIKGQKIENDKRQRTLSWSNSYLDLIKLKINTWSAIQHSSKIYDQQNGI